MNHLEFTNTVEGWYKLEAIDSSGNCRVLADWFPNLITNAGLNRMGDFSDYLEHCQIGTGTTPPSNTDVGLAARTASVTSPTRTYEVKNVPPYYSTSVNVYVFPTGVARTVSEIGVGWASIGSLFSRVVLLDTRGTPLIVRTSPDESLRVSYQLRVYPPEADTVGTSTIFGTARTWTARAAGVTNSRDFAASWSLPSTSYTPSQVAASAIAYNGVIGDITSTPTGTASTGVVNSQAYGNNTLIRSINTLWDFSAGNLSGGIRSVRVTVGWTSWQVEFNPPIAKNSSQILSLKFTHSWGRKV